MRKLDIIVTHYNEEWEVGEKFFEMLALQRGVDFSEIRVMLIHDGSEPFADWMFSGYPFKVEQIPIMHGGVSRARNIGIEHSDAEWIMFCDFDDLFASVYSLRHVLTLLPADGYDILWSDFYSEDRMMNGELRMHRRTQNSVFIHAKWFRRSFLLENEIRFPEDLDFNEDSAFCAIAFAVCPYERVGRINAETPLYIWTFREGSLTATKGTRWKALKGLYFRNKKVVEAFRKYLGDDRYRAMVCRACFDAYHMLNLEEFPDEMQDILDDFRRFWAEHKEDFLLCGRAARLETEKISKLERETGDKEEEMRWGRNDLKLNKRVSFGEWISKIEGDDVSVF